LDPTLAIAYYERGNVYQAKGTLDRAIEDYHQAISLSPEYAEAYFGLAKAYEKKGHALQRKLRGEEQGNGNNQGVVPPLVDHRPMGRAAYRTELSPILLSSAASRGECSACSGLTAERKCRGCGLFLCGAHKECPECESDDLRPAPRLG